MSTTPFHLNAPGIAHDPDWFRKAVFYEVLVRAFSDANGDGVGDLRGVIDRLGYLELLGGGPPGVAGQQGRQRLTEEHGHQRERDPQAE